MKAKLDKFCIWNGKMDILNAVAVFQESKGIFVQLIKLVVFDVI